MMNGYSKGQEAVGDPHDQTTARPPTTTSLILFLAAVAVVTTLSIVFILLQPWHSLSVGSITTPVGVQQLREDATDDYPARTPHQRRMDQAFLDSIETFGIDGMKEIYSKQHQLGNNGK